MPLISASSGRFPWARLQPLPSLCSVQGLQLALFPLESPLCAPINHSHFTKTYNWNQNQPNKRGLYAKTSAVIRNSLPPKQYALLNHLMEVLITWIEVKGGDSCGMRETGETSLRTRRGGDGSSLPPRNAST